VERGICPIATLYSLESAHKAGRCKQGEINFHGAESYLIFVQIIYIKKLQAIYLMLYKRWCKTAKIKKFKHELMY